LLIGFNWLEFDSVAAQHCMMAVALDASSTHRLQSPFLKMQWRAVTCRLAAMLVHYILMCTVGTLRVCKSFACSSQSCSSPQSFAAVSHLRSVVAYVVRSQ
jgi:hypothetical protein